MTVRKSKTKKKKVVVAVSGGFDPIHVGHVRMFQEAKKLGDELVVILNNDNWLRRKKIAFSCRTRNGRKCLRRLASVDRVVVSET